MGQNSYFSQLLDMKYPSVPVVNNLSILLAGHEKLA